MAKRGEKTCIIFWSILPPAPDGAGSTGSLSGAELDKRGVAYQVHFSEKPGDMARMVSDLTENEVHLIVLGGDGTVNEALQGVRDFKKTRFSHIPTGSSNDLARDTGISRDPAKALVQLLENGKEIPMDVGVVHYHTAYIPQENSLPEHVVLPKRGLPGNGLQETSRAGPDVPGQLRNRLRCRTSASRPCPPDSRTCSTGSVWAS